MSNGETLETDLIVKDLNDVYLGKYHTELKETPIRIVISVCSSFPEVVINPGDTAHTHIVNSNRTSVADVRLDSEMII